MHIGICLYNRV